MNVENYNERFLSYYPISYLKISFWILPIVRILLFVFVYAIVYSNLIVLLHVIDEQFNCIAKQFVLLQRTVL